MLVSSDEQDMDDSVFDTDGTARDWAHPPAVELYNPAPKSKQREPANLLPFRMGSFVLDAKARAAIGGLLSRFGQLMELHRSGDGEVFYMFSCRGRHCDARIESIGSTWPGIERRSHQTSTPWTLFSISATCQMPQRPSGIGLST